MTPAGFRAIRKQLGLKQAGLALMLGLASSDSVSKIERGETNPSETTLRLMRAYADGYRSNDWPAKPQQIA